MKIDFYEEFPTNQNLAKLRLVGFRTEVYLAAKNLDEFRRLGRLVKRINKLATAQYWPILEKSEGYWMSPFSATKALERVIGELECAENKLKVVWDAELPFHNKWLLLLSLPKFLHNKRLITRFLKTTKHEVLVTENIILGTSFFGKIFGVYYKRYHGRKTLMFYTSILGALREVFLARLRKEHYTLGDKLTVGLGTTAKGIRGDEPILKPEELDNDLEDLNKIGINHAIIFRLGGLNKDYIKVIEKYIT